MCEREAGIFHQQAEAQGPERGNEYVRFQGHVCDGCGKKEWNGRIFVAHSEIR